MLANPGFGSTAAGEHAHPSCFPRRTVTVSPVSSEIPVEPGADTQVCYRHPDRHTRLACSDCGRPICSACSIDAAVGQKCPQCVAQVGRQKTIDARRTIRSGSTPVTMAIIAVTAAVFLLGQAFEASLAQVSPLVEAGEWWRIFTPVLVHASLTHILFNMWALYALGPQIERGVGSMPFLALYVASAGMGGVAAQLLTPGNFTAVGASGAVFGLFGVWLNLAIRRRNTAYGRSLLSQLGFLLLINAALPFVIRDISWQAHLGGFVTGFVIGEVWSRIKGQEAERNSTLVGAAVAILAAVAVTLI